MHDCATFRRQAPERGATQPTTCPEDGDMARHELDRAFLKTVSLLYVEDDEDVSKQLVRFLRHRVGSLLVAANGAAGLEAFCAHGPQLVITDIQMPGMDGLCMALEIRKLNQSVPIVVTTAFEQTDYLLRSIDIGVDKYVTKPIDVDRLLAALLDCAHRLRAEQMLDRQRSLEAEALRIKHLEAMGVMAGGMAHDFNNLLQVMLGYVCLAQNHAEPGSAVRELLDKAEAGFAEALELGQRLRLLGKGNDALAQSAPLGRLIAGWVGAQLEGNRVLAEFDLPNHLPFAYFVPSQLQQVFSFLTVNALEAMPEGGTLHIAGRAHTVSGSDPLPLADGEYLHISFQDSGQGVAPEHLSRIFDPYFTTKELGSQKGMGLSLALCHAIVWKHRGLISVESPPGEGACFHIYLPVA